MDGKTEIKRLFEGRNILLADDNDLNREAIREMLVKSGFTVECAKNGKEVIAAFNCSDDGEFCAILMDTTMPIYDGINAAGIIRSSQHPDAESIPIIAVTITDSEHERKSALAAGMNDYLVKPFSADELINLISKYIS